MPLGERVFSILLLTYPKTFRDHYREDLLVFFRADRDRASHAGRFWRKTLSDLVRTAVTARVAADQTRNSPGFDPHRNRKRGGFDSILQDLRFALRVMLRSPLFSIVSLVTMTLGVGANTAMFSLVHGVILKPLPYPEAEQIVLLSENNLERGWSSFTVTPPNFWAWQERNRSMEMLASFRTGSVTYTDGDRPESIPVCRVSENYLGILGGEPVRGRGITAEDLEPGGPPVAVITHGFWQRAFGGASDVLGRSIALDGVTHTVVGILAEDWRATAENRIDVILPLIPQPHWPNARWAHFLNVIARLAPGVSLEQAREDMSSVAAALEAEFADSNAGWGVNIAPIGDVILGSASLQLLILQACVGLVLLISCANVANMMLTRAVVRSRELAIRTALGAARSRLIRQLLTESCLLAFVSGLAGVGLAYISIEIFVAAWPTMLPRMHEVEIGGAVLLFALGASLATAVLLGLVPALSGVGRNLTDTLRQGARTLTGDISRRWMRASLIVAEVSLAVVLLIGSGLLVRSLLALQSVDAGFLSEDRLVLSTPLQQAKYPTDQEVRIFADAVLDRLGAVPGVESSSITSLVPLAGRDERTGVLFEGRSSDGPEDDVSALVYRVGGGYHETMGIRLVAGRGITLEDREDRVPVAVVSETFAARHFPDEDPLGKRIRFGAGESIPWVEVVGVAGDVRHYALGLRATPQVYVPFAQWPSRNANFVIKAALSPLGLVDAVRDAIEAVDPVQPVVGISTLNSLLANSIAMPRFRTTLMSGFGLTALLLAMVGVYGVMAYNVSQRSKEIGVRMALGAQRHSVSSMVLREGIPMVATGLGIGLLGAFVLSKVLDSLVFGVGVRDPWVFSVVTIVLLAVAGTAMLIPARRATRVDLVAVLADE